MKSKREWNVIHATLAFGMRSEDFKKMEERRKDRSLGKMIIVGLIMYDQVCLSIGVEFYANSFFNHLVTTN